MSTSLFVYNNLQNNATNVTINYNATMDNVSEVVGTTLAYTLLSLLLTFLSYAFIASSITSYFYKDFDGKIFEGVVGYWKKGGEIMFRCVFAFFLKWVLFIVGWTLYSSGVLGGAWIKPKPDQLQFGVALSQTDVFFLCFTAIGFTLMSWGDILVGLKFRVRNLSDEEKNLAESARLFTAFRVVLPVMTAAALVLLPGAYQFAIANPSTVIHSGSGALVAFNLATGVILTVLLILRATLSSPAGVAWCRSRGLENASKTKLANMATSVMFADVYLLTQKPEGLIKGATYGFMGGIYMPFGWILCHMFYTVSCGFSIYQDGTRPWVWGIVAALVPFIYMLKSQKWRTYLGYHAAMGSYYAITNILCASITGPLNSSLSSTTYAPVVTEFTASGGIRYYNITLNKLTTQSEFLLVAQNPSTLASMRVSTDFMCISALILAIVSFLLNTMYFDAEKLADNVKVIDKKT